MPETPLALSWFAYGLFKRLKKDLPASEYEEFVRWWNSRILTGTCGSSQLELEGSRVTPQVRVYTRYGDRIQDLAASSGLRPGLHELKGGSTPLSLSQRTAEEIAKDQWLASRGYTIYWDFQVAPRDELMSALYSAGLHPVIW